MTNFQTFLLALILVELWLAGRAIVDALKKITKTLDDLNLELWDLARADCFTFVRRDAERTAFVQRDDAQRIAAAKAGS